MTREQRLMPNDEPRWIRCYDNGGETFDRYTVVFTGRYTHKTGGEHWYLGMSAEPFHPQGFGQHGGTMGAPCDAPDGKWPPAIGRTNHLGTRIPWSALPADCQACAERTYRDLWDLPA